MAETVQDVLEEMEDLGRRGHSLVLTGTEVRRLADRIEAALAASGPVAWIEPAAIDAFNKHRNEDDFWSPAWAGPRNDDEIKCVPLFTAPQPAPLQQATIDLSAHMDTVREAVCEALNYERERSRIYKGYPEAEFHERWADKYADLLALIDGAKP